MSVANSKSKDCANNNLIEQRQKMGRERTGDKGSGPMMLQSTQFLQWLLLSAYRHIFLFMTVVGHPDFLGR